MIPRYKIIVIISIGQIRDQNIRMGSRCLWDDTHDNFSSHIFKNNSLFAAATVFGVYFEWVFQNVCGVLVTSDFQWFFQPLSDVNTIHW